MICTADCLNVELDKITTIRLENQDPIGFIKHYQRDPEPKVNGRTLSKKLAFIDRAKTLNKI